MSEINSKVKSMDVGEHSSPRKKIRKRSHLSNQTKFKRERNSPIRRKINREKYWNIPPPPNTDDTDDECSLYAELHSLREFHSLIDMPASVKRFYRKMFVYTNFTKGANKTLDVNSSAAVGIEHKALETKFKHEENLPVRRRITMEKYWEIPPPVRDNPEICSFYAKLKSMREFHSLIDTPTAVTNFYRKMVAYNRIRGANRLLVDSSSASVGIVNKISLGHINCSYTNRVLKPFIFQDFEVISPWLKMRNELREAFLKRYPDRKIMKYKKHPINYMYITDYYIPAINSLAETYFWPGIDLSIALGYPEFSCVALYKKIIVGFGIMTPGTHWNEAYISFFFVRPQWRKSGIGTFILYHLINTAISWNITLHVGLSNDAVLLYNKFTFKVLRKFFDERSAIKKDESGHAFFMQLEKSLIT